MATKTRATVEELAREIADLRHQRHTAQQEAQRAAQLLKELPTRRANLLASIGGGDSSSSEEQEAGDGAALELGALAGALREEAAALSRTKEIAEEATKELDRLILDAEVRHHEAEKRLARRRYEELCEQRYVLDGEAEQAVAALLEVLERLERLYEEQVSAAAEADDASPGRHEPRTTIEQWLARRLREWLGGLGSLQRYDAPLGELDPLALKPEEEGEKAREEQEGSGQVG